MPKLVNLTPHALNIYDEDKMPVATLPAEPVPARVAVSRELIGREFGVPIFRTVYGDINDLPEPETNTIFIVSLLVSQAVPSRLDVLSPGELLRDEKGQPIGCVGLTK